MDNESVKEIINNESVDIWRKQLLRQSKEGRRLRCLVKSLGIAQVSIFAESSKNTLVLPCLSIETFTLIFLEDFIL